MYIYMKGRKRADSAGRFYTDNICYLKEVIEKKTAKRFI